MIGMPNSSKGSIPRVLGHNLTSDLEHRDPTSELSDVDGGNMIAAIDKMSKSWQYDHASVDTHLTYDEAGRVVKVIKKRDAEFARSAIRECEAIWSDEALGLVEDPEDVYSGAVELVYGTTGCSEDDEECEMGDDGRFVESYNAPLDPHDVVFDASQYITAAKAMQQTKEYKQASEDERQSMLEKLADELIYSADWFPCARDKRVRGKAAVILQQIKAGKMTKAMLGKLTLSVDERAKKQVALKAQIRKVTGKARGKVMVQAQAVNMSRINAMRNARGFEYQWVGTEEMGSWVCVARKGNTVKNTTKLSQGEISMLWDAFRQWEIESSGSSKLPAWSYKRALSAKLQRMVVKQEITRQQAQERYQAALVRVLQIPVEQAVSAQLISNQY